MNRSYAFAVLRVEPQGAGKGFKIDLEAPDEDGLFRLANHHLPELRKRLRKDGHTTTRGFLIIGGGDGIYADVWWIKSRGFNWVRA